MKDTPINTILCGDAREQMATLPTGSVDCIITSPPYWGLRQYLFEGAVIIRGDIKEDVKIKIEQELTQLGITPKLG